jgi:hypothetical protein
MGGEAGEHPPMVLGGERFIEIVHYVNAHNAD